MRRNYRRVLSLLLTVLLLVAAVATVFADDADDNTVTISVNNNANLSNAGSSFHIAKSSKLPFGKYPRTEWKDGQNVYLDWTAWVGDGFATSKGIVYPDDMEFDQDTELRGSTKKALSEVCKVTFGTLQLDGVYNVGSGEPIEFGTTQNRTVIATGKWKETGGNSGPGGTKCTITFEANGGTVDPTSAETGEDGKLTYLPIPTHETWTFDGWYTSAEGGTEVTKDTVFSGNDTIYAHWAKIFTITFNAGEGTVTPASAETDKDGKLSTLPEPTREGYTCEGWYTMPGGSGEKVTTATVFDGPATIYARWKQNGNGGGTTTPPSGGGSTSSPSYNVSTSSGTSKGTVATDRTSAQKGSTVTVTSKAGSGYISGKPTVTDKNGNSVAVVDNGDGTYSFTMPEGSVTVTGNYITPAQMFSDVTDGWYQNAVAYVVENRLMNGMGDGSTFEPGTPTSRGMLVTILYRLEGEPAVSGSSGFADVAASQWYTKAVIWASANGIVDGYGNGSFGPGDPITREQFATILYRYAQYKKLNTSASNDLSGYTDADRVSSWAADGMKWANGSGLITGVTSTTLVPGNKASRAEAATILMRYCEKIAQ